MADAVRRRTPGARDLTAILAPMRRGGSDPTMLLDRSQAWRAVSTPDGPASQHLIAEPDAVTSRCWGPGAAWLDARTEDLLGLRDDHAPFDTLLSIARSQPPWSDDAASGRAVLERHWRRHRLTWAVPRGHHVWESVVAAVLEQKVTGLEAWRSWRWLAEAAGDPAPGPVPDGLRLAPTPAQLRLVPSWQWRRWGVDRDRSDTLQRLARLPHVLARLPDLDPVEARRQLTSIPGIGAWTYAEVAQRALGDPDAVSVGDFHLATGIVYACTGQLGGTDEQLLALLEPFRGQRFKVVRMIELAGIRPPRRGPRMSVPRHRYG